LHDNERACCLGRLAQAGAPGEGDTLTDCSVQSKALADGSIDWPGRHEAAQTAQQTRLKAYGPAHSVGSSIARRISAATVYGPAAVLVFAAMLVATLFTPSA
jgi:hypothetical protein